LKPGPPPPTPPSPPAPFKSPTPRQRNLIYTLWCPLSLSLSFFFSLCVCAMVPAFLRIDFFFFLRFFPFSVLFVVAFLFEDLPFPSFSYPTPPPHTPIQHFFPPLEEFGFLFGNPVKKTGVVLNDGLVWLGPAGSVQRFQGLLLQPSPPLFVSFFFF